MGTQQLERKQWAPNLRRVHWSTPGPGQNKFPKRPRVGRWDTLRTDSWTVALCRRAANRWTQLLPRTDLSGDWDPWFPRYLEQRSRPWALWMGLWGSASLDGETLTFSVSLSSEGDLPFPPVMNTGITNHVSHVSDHWKPQTFSYDTVDTEDRSFTFAPTLKPQSLINCSSCYLTSE